VVFGDPEPRVSESLGLLCGFNGVRVGIGRGAVVGNWRQIYGREFHI